VDPPDKDMGDQAGIVLYVGRDATSGAGECPGSRHCLALIDAQCIPCTVQHVEHLHEAGVEIPSWLDGTPVLVDAVLRQAFKGTQAVSFLESAARASAEAALTREAEVASASAAASARATASARAASAARAVSARAASMAPGPVGGEGDEGDEGEEGDEGDAWGQRPSTEAGLPVRPGQGMPPPVSHEPPRDGKVTKDDLQRYMEARNRTS